MIRKLITVLFFHSNSCQLKIIALALASTLAMLLGGLMNAIVKMCFVCKKTNVKGCKNTLDK